MEFWKSLAGMFEVELTSAEPETALDFVSSKGIEMKALRKTDELTYSFHIHRKDIKVLSDVCKKRGETIRIERKLGLYWRAKDLLARPVLLAGTVFLLWLVLFLPTRVLFIRVEGNVSVPARRILAAAEDCGICFGASRREVRSEKTKNALLSAVEELQWAGVNTSGCVATISVRERAKTANTAEKGTVASIVAERDGYIISCTVTRGNALVQVGQSVQEGQILISGYTDCGLCIQATRAEGEILAQTYRNLEAVTPSDCLQYGAVQDIKRKYSLLIRKKRINLWKDSGIWDGSCGRMYEEYYITLPGGFQLPIALCVEKYTFCETTVSEIPQLEVEEALGVFADNYLSQQMISGKILNAVQAVSLENGVYRLNGAYACTEMIGKVQQEQIGDTNGKNS